MNGNARMVRLLLRYGADPKLRDGDKHTALELASRKSNSDSSLPHPNYPQTIALLKRAARR